MSKTIPVFFVLLLGVLLGGCKTKADLRREAELKALQYKITEERAQQDEETQATKMELNRLNAVVEQLYEQNNSLRKTVEDLKQEIAKRNAPPEPDNRPDSGAKVTYDTAKALFESGKYGAAATALNRVIPTLKEAEKKSEAQFLLAESQFALRNYRVAALEFSRFRKLYPKSEKNPRAIYRQANCFKNLEMKNEAILFYEELMESYAKHPLASKAKKELSELTKKPADAKSKTKKKSK